MTTTSGTPLVDTDSSTQPLAQFGEFFSFGGTLLVLFLWVRFKEHARSARWVVADPIRSASWALAW